MVLSIARQIEKSELAREQSNARARTSVLGSARSSKSHPCAVLFSTFFGYLENLRNLTVE